MTHQQSLTTTIGFTHHQAEVVDASAAFIALAHAAARRSFDEDHRGNILSTVDVAHSVSALATIDRAAPRVLHAQAVTDTVSTITTVLGARRTIFVTALIAVAISAEIVATHDVLFNFDFGLDFGLGFGLCGGLLGWFAFVALVSFFRGIDRCVLSFGGIYRDTHSIQAGLTQKTLAFLRAARLGRAVET